MRPPMLFLTVAFGVGLWAGLDPFVFPGRALPGGALWIVALPVVALAAWLARRAPLGPAAGHMGGAGPPPGPAAGRRPHGRSRTAACPATRSGRCRGSVAMRVPPRTPDGWVAA